jgi:uncharacterized protein YeaO (DUF488 family)
MDMKHGKITWEQYEAGYRELIRLRMQTRMKEFMEIAEAAKKENVYLACFCKDERICHRKLAQEIIEKLME